MLQNDSACVFLELWELNYCENQQSFKKEDPSCWNGSSGLEPTPTQDLKDLREDVSGGSQQVGVPQWSQKQTPRKHCHHEQ